MFLFFMFSKVDLLAFLYLQDTGESVYDIPWKIMYFDPRNKIQKDLLIEQNKNVQNKWKSSGTLEK